MIPLGPFVTLALWLAVGIAIARHNATATERGANQLPLIELVPIAAAVAMVQLLLDLHRPWLGDLAAIGIHAIGAVVVWLRRN